MEAKVWALITISAIEAGCSGILAASQDVIDHIEANDGPDDLCIFGNGFLEVPGLYIWRGTMTQALEGEGGTLEHCAPEHIGPWIEKNGGPE